MGHMKTILATYGHQVVLFLEEKLVDELSIPQTLIDVSVLDTRVITWQAGKRTCILCVVGML